MSNRRVKAKLRQLVKLHRIHQRYKPTSHR